MLSVQAVSLCMDTNEVVNSIVYVKILDNEKQVQQAAFWEYNKIVLQVLFFFILCVLSSLQRAGVSHHALPSLSK